MGLVSCCIQPPKVCCRMFREVWWNVNACMLGPVWDQFGAGLEPAWGQYVATLENRKQTTTRTMCAYVKHIHEPHLAVLGVCLFFLDISQTYRAPYFWLSWSLCKPGADQPSVNAIHTTCCFYGLERRCSESKKCALRNEYG